jgi:uncharacterized protein YecE (DUF72 family)
MRYTGGVGRAYIGCSGYSYPHWRHGVFYPKNLKIKDEFAYYASRFNTVEINSTFYGLPRGETWQKWRQRAPQGFLYALKMSRFLTHRRKLSRAEEPWRRFWQGAQKLGSHLGPILFQLPPRWGRNLKKLENLSATLPPHLRFAFEFRDASWLNPETYQCLRKHNWGLVVVSHPQLPVVDEITADFVYLRWHGREKLYTSNYSEEELSGWAGKIRNWLGSGFDVYGYFNNDALGFAPRNAAALIERLGDFYREEQ